MTHTSLTHCTLLACHTVYRGSGEGSVVSRVCGAVLVRYLSVGEVLLSLCGLALAIYWMMFWRYEYHRIPDEGAWNAGKGLCVYQ